MSRVTDIQKQELEKELDSLTEQYTEVNKDRRLARDKRNRLILQQQADDLLKQMGEVQDKLNSQSSQANLPQENFNQIYLTLQENLPKIDFDKAMKVVDKKLDGFGQELGETIFFLENTHPMAGELCICRIKENLNNYTGTLRPLPVGITHSSSRNEFGILEPLAQHLKINREFADDIIKYSQEIISGICKSLQTGSVIFITINKWNYIEPQDKVISWFLDKFWSHLIEKTYKTIQEKDLRQVKIIAIINAESKLSTKDRKLLLGNDSVTKIPLVKWNEKDINKWLGSYSSCLSQKGLSGSEIDFLAKDIHSKTERGTPLMVCEALKKEFVPIT